MLFACCLWLVLAMVAEIGELGAAQRVQYAPVFGTQIELGCVNVRVLCAWLLPWVAVAPTIFQTLYRGF
jgi:hypothetical protein